MASLARQILMPVLKNNLAATTKYLHSSTCAFATSKVNEVVKPVKITPDTPNINGGNIKLLVSESCLKRLREICTDGSFLRVTVEGGGCSGFQYKFGLDTKLNDDDVEFGEEKAKVVIDNVSLEYCDGSTVDYHTELIRAGFRITANPLAEQGCSCGASFSVKLD